MATNLVRVHRAYRYDPDGPPPLTVISVDRELSHTHLDESAYAEDARLIADALLGAIPGGTMDALLIRLLQERASRLAVPLHREASE